MPFTIAHAAAALPLRKLNLVWSAFVIGSFAPDFPYIVGNIRYRGLGHNMPGVLLFTLPASLAALWLFHVALKRPAAGLFPAGWQERLYPYLGAFRFGGLHRFAAILFSLALGIVLHLLWDSFTHPFTAPWRHSHWLQSWISVPRLGLTPMYRVLQYVSTVAGLLALTIWALLWYRNTPPHRASTPPHSRVWLAVFIFLVAGIIGAVRGWVIFHTVAGLKSEDGFMLAFSVTSLAVAFWSLFAYCLLVTAGLISTSR